MPLLLLFLALTVAAALLFWRVTTQTSYRVKNRDVRPHYSSHPRRERPGPDLSKMLD
ncbi:MAG: hypothetical protein OEV40_24270 [Acidimicrobiia bacterium]|nr:hypothetical protein [Acidimicrobiia bacterium]